MGIVLIITENVMYKTHFIGFWTCSAGWFSSFYQLAELCYKNEEPLPNGSSKNYQRLFLNPETENFPVFWINPHTVFDDISTKNKFTIFVFCF